MGKLDNKVAVVTGGSSGLALASAKLFVEEGAQVFITGRDQTRLTAAAQAIGHGVTPVQGDASSLADLDRLFEAVRDADRGIDVLFASAGQAEAGVLGDITEASFDAQFGLNVRGTLFTVQKALPLLNDGASIFVTGSMASLKGFPGAGVYAASKAALRSFARTWATELKDRNIRVNVLSPGPVDTPAMDANGPEAKAQYNALIPRGEMGRPEEIASAALFLASSDSSYVNAIELFVDGGTGQI